MENTQGIDFFLVITIGTLVILMIIFFIILFVLTHQKKVLEQKNILSAKESEFQRNLLNASLEAAEEERAKIAANLHDDIGMTLNVLRMKVYKIAKHEDKEEVKKVLLPETNQLMDDTIQQIRNIMSDLRPGLLAERGVLDALDELCLKISSAGSISVTFTSDNKFVQLDYKTSLQYYRLISELLNNIIKHSGASKISVEAFSANRPLEIKIKHNGKGVSSEEIKELTANSKGLGLKSIAARTQMLGVRLEYLKEPASVILLAQGVA